VKNIFVLGSDDFNLAQMRALKGAQNYCFHELFHHREVKASPEIPAQRLYEEAIERLDHFDGSIDAIVGYWDFPVSTMLPLLCRRYGLPSPSFEAVLKCEHKYWSRLEQRRVVPEHVPDFCAVDPFADDAAGQISIDYPFWLKPVKAASSYLGFKIRSASELETAFDRIRRGIFRFAKPFNYLLQFADLPDEIAAVDGYHCIAESIISRGRQVTLEGYVYRGEVTVYGIVDSIREGRHRSSFARYQYPSNIPRGIAATMVSLTRRYLEYIGFDNGPFNIEYYWDSARQRIWLLQVNTRISKSHCPLFRHVDGASHHKVLLDLALGLCPEFPYRAGQYRCAAKFMWREYEDAKVTRVPTSAELEDICSRFPGAEIQMHVREGMRLSELTDQDSYSYEVAVVFLGADSQKELLDKYRAVREAILLELIPVGAVPRMPAGKG